MRFIYLLLLFTTSIFANTKPLTINIYTNFNGIGLETDERVLRKAIEKLGHTVNSFYWGTEKNQEADINIFIEQIVIDKIPLAKRNWFISNPEWYGQDKKLLKQMDLILCRTQQSLQIFQYLKNTYYLGFTSPDAYRPEIPKEFSHWVHLPGASNFQKGTKDVMLAWRHYPGLPEMILVDWTGTLSTRAPNLTIIPHKVSLDEYRRLQNQYIFHLCPSSSEGFGHYIMEAMSAGAVILTTNGAPMNELIRDPRCLIPVKSSAPYRMGTRYDIHPIYMRHKIVALSKLSEEELLAIGMANRQEYLRRTQEFHERLKLLLDTTWKQLNS
jgi:glycosyltransferase involved in cell wall biosynthesis